MKAKKFSILAHFDHIDSCEYLKFSIGTQCTTHMKGNSSSIVLNVFLISLVCLPFDHLPWNLQENQNKNILNWISSRLHYLTNCFSPFFPIISSCVLFISIDNMYCMLILIKIECCNRCHTHAQMQTSVLIFMVIQLARPTITPTENW